MHASYLIIYRIGSRNGVTITLSSHKGKNRVDLCHNDNGLVWYAETEYCTNYIVVAFGLKTDIIIVHSNNETVFAFVRLQGTAPVDWT